ncbi:hypothetical protein QR680_007537 [Steinernema hermaphroditum]|uniref:Uncharacterized protein n=1 Tax=Steinernema hermaphroditum TaxID=289476 RepID=A0AA39IFN0_9BILA|nr:hypothetical protein QR680_007537 [Steinernema hermaphroditum]
MASPLVARFCRITRAEGPLAQGYLNANYGDLNGALSDFYLMERSTFINVDELKKAGLNYKMPITTTPSFDGPLVNSKLVEVLLPYVEHHLRKSASSSLSPREQLVVYIAAMSEKGNLFELAKRFRISYRLVMPTVLEVSSVINSIFSLPQLTKEKLREVAKEFEKRTGFPRIVGYLGAWSGMVLICDVDGKVIAVEDSSSYWVVRSIENLAHLLPDPEPLRPSAPKDKIAFRFLSAGCTRHNLTFIPYSPGYKCKLSSKENHFNTIVNGILHEQEDRIHLLNAMFPTHTKHIQRSHYKDVLLSYIHVYNLMRGNPKCFHPYVDRYNIPARRWYSSYYATPKDPEADKIAEYLYEKKSRT